MKLQDYLFKKETSIKEFAVELGVSDMAVRYWLNGKRIPTQDVMRNIVEKTNGEVQPNDFFNIPTQGEDAA